MRREEVRPGLQRYMTERRLRMLEHTERKADYDVARKEARK